MLNLVRLANKTVSSDKNFPSIEVQKSGIKLNTLAILKLGAVPGVSKIDVAVDGIGSGATLYISCLEGTSAEGRLLSKNSSLNSSSIKAALEEFKASVFEITTDSIEFEGLTWYIVMPRYDAEASTRKVNEEPVSSKTPVEDTVTTQVVENQEESLSFFDDSEL